MFSNNLFQTRPKLLSSISDMRASEKCVDRVTGACDCIQAEVEKGFTMLMVLTKMIQQWPRLKTCLIQNRSTQTIPYFRSDRLKNYPVWPHAYLLRLRKYSSRQNGERDSHAMLSVRPLCRLTSMFVSRQSRVYQWDR